MQESEKDLNNVEGEASGGSTQRIYEVGYLVVPTVKEEDVSSIYGNMKDLVSSLGGEVISDEMPRMIQLAYSMQKTVSNVRSKFNSAYFGWVKFSMESSKAADMKKKLDQDPNILRFLTIKTVKENTIASKKFIGGGLHKKPTYTKKEGEEAAAPINKEELDQEIDAMVATQ